MVPAQTLIRAMVPVRRCITALTSQSTWARMSGLMGSGRKGGAAAVLGGIALLLLCTAACISHRPHSYRLPPRGDPERGAAEACFRACKESHDRDVRAGKTVGSIFYACLRRCPGMRLVPGCTDLEDTVACELRPVVGAALTGSSGRSR
jgi:hypothetical protein